LWAGGLNDDQGHFVDQPIPWDALIKVGSLGFCMVGKRLNLKQNIKIG
jgi:hypothetical protein